MTIKDIMNKKFSFSGIYKYTNLINGKVYIGQSQNLYKRFQDYNKNRFSKHLGRAIKKYGLENFNIEILESNIDLDKLNEREQYYMDLYNSYNHNFGYNIAPIAGTTRGIKLSQKQVEFLRNLNKKRVGELNSFYGHKHTEETKKLISEKKKGTKLSKSHIEKFCIAGSNACKKKVVQKDKNTGEIIKIWDSIKNASRTLLIADVDISRCAMGKRKSAKDFCWEYYTE